MRLWLPLLLAGSVFAAGCATVPPGEGGILFRSYSDKKPKPVLREGRYLKAFWRRLYLYDLRWKTSSEKADIQTNDKLHMTVMTSITYRLRTENLYNIHQSLGPDYYRTTIKPSLLTAVRTEFSKHSHDVLVPKSSELQKNILEEIRRDLEPYGIEVSRAVFDDIDFPAELANAVLKQMSTLQATKSKELEQALAKREAEVAVEKAKGESQVRLAARESEVLIAKKDAEIAEIHARSEAEATKIRSGQITPAYLRLRAIEAMEKISHGPNSKIYIVPTGKDGVPLTVHPND